MSRESQNGLKMKISKNRLFHNGYLTLYYSVKDSEIYGRERHKNQNHCIH